MSNCGGGYDASAPTAAASTGTRSPSFAWSLRSLYVYGEMFPSGVCVVLDVMVSVDGVRHPGGWVQTATLRYDEPTNVNLPSNNLLEGSIGNST